MTQTAKCVLCKCEDPSSNPDIMLRKAHTCNLSAWEAEMGIAGQQA